MQPGLQLQSDPLRDEHSVLEDMFSTPTQPVLGVSTVKAIVVAAQQGQRIYTITAQNLATALDQITLPADVETDIANAVNAGFQVTTHQTDIQYAGLEIGSASCRERVCQYG